MHTCLYIHVHTHTYTHHHHLGSFQSRLSMRCLWGPRIGFQHLSSSITHHTLTLYELQSFFFFYFAELQFPCLTVWNNIKSRGCIDLMKFLIPLFHCLSLFCPGGGVVSQSHPFCLSCLPRKSKRLKVTAQRLQCNNVGDGIPG